MELGKAYIQVIPSTQGIKGQLTTELTGATAEAGSASGSKFGAGFGKTAATALKASGVAAAGLTIAKGWSRMTAIDDAKAKLTALGHSVQEVQAISENANAAVKGTAYGMDAAMTAAASATAAGIEPGKELTRYLSLMGDAAAVAGVDMNEMGSIFNKVAANGKVSTEEMNQLADRGIPIWQLLAKETGMSMDELRTAISNGEIDINDFQNAIETGMGGAAKTIGSTTISGAISNIGASLSRMGANFLGSADDANSFAGKLLPLFNNLMDFMGKLEGGAKVLGSVLGSVMGPIMDGVSKIFTTISGNIGTLSPLKSILMEVGSMLGDLVAAMFPAIQAGIKAVFKLLKALMPVISGVMSKVTPIAKVVIKIIASVIKTVAKVVSSVANAAAKIISKFTSIKNKVQGIVKKIKGFFPFNIGKIINMKLPKINIETGSKSFFGKTIKYPKGFNVSWHAKAMENPYLFSNATLFGAGETGDEVLYGRKALMKDIAEAAGGGNTFNVTLNANGTENPEQYAQRFARELRRQVRMGAV